MEIKTKLIIDIYKSNLCFKIFINIPFNSENYLNGRGYPLVDIILKYQIRYEYRLNVKKINKI